MADVSETAAAWLLSVLHRMPVAICAIYVEYGEAISPRQEPLVYFNAFGFESLAGGKFDPANMDHINELGDYTWESADDCIFPATAHTGTEWMAALRAAAESPAVVAAATARGVRLIIGEHDCEVFVIL